MVQNRGHAPIIIEEFSGLFKRGDADSCPLDHFSDCENVKSIESGFETRPGLDTLVAKGNIVRMYNYKMAEGESLIALDINGDFWHALLDGSGTVFGPILSISDATDFDIYTTGSYCYITPFTTFIDNNGTEFQKGLENEFVYVYKGDGTSARKAAGSGPIGGSSCLVGYPFQVFGLGVVNKGIHIIGVTQYDGGDESGGLGPEGLSVILVEDDESEISLNNIPLGDVGAVGRKIYMTKAIDLSDWNPDGDLRSNYTFYLAKDIPDNTTITAVINIADTSLTIPFVGGGGLNTLTNGNMFTENTNTDGFVDLGLHVIGVLFETDTGYFTAPGPDFFSVQSFVNETRAIGVHYIPVSPDSFVIRRHLVATKRILDFNGNNRKPEFQFQLFFIPDGTIDNNTDTDKVVSFYDADLLEDASHLIDNFSEIPAGVNLASYNGRMTLCGTFDNPSRVYVSAKLEPEAIDQIDGILDLPIDGNPCTMSQEFRDVLYLFKKTRTYSSVDNGDVPSTWDIVPLDLGIGCPVHGIAQVLDSGGVNIDFLLICDFSGIMLFNGNYTRPELTWKIQDYWLALDKNDYKNIQILNDTVNQFIYLTLPNKKILFADYSNGLNPKSIRWWPWRFDIETNTIALYNVNTLAIGSKQLI